jgi:hypothetical protein
MNFYHVRLDRALAGALLSACMLFTAAGAYAQAPTPADTSEPAAPAAPAAPADAGAPMAPNGPATAPVATTTVPAGSAINTLLTSPDINTKNAKDGDPVTLQIVGPYPEGNTNLEGASVHGHVESVRSAGQGRKALLTLAFDSITFADGHTGPISGSVLKMEAKSQNTTARKGIGAAAGAAVGSQTVGRILGGTLGSVVGLVGGALGGFAYANNSKANFNVATGARVQIQTASNLEVPQRQAGQ